MEKSQNERIKIERIESDDPSFEDLLYRENFYSDIKNITQAIYFKKFLEDKWRLVCDIEKTAENNYRNNPRLIEYIKLRDKAYEINQFITNNLEFGSEESKEKEEEEKSLESQADFILAQDPTLKILEDELGNEWNEASKKKNNFYRDTNILRKIKIIDKVLIPYFEQEEEVGYFENEKIQELNKQRDEFYILLDRDAGNRELESGIEAVEDEIKNLPKTIDFKKQKLDLMRRNLTHAIKKVSDGFL